MDRRNTFSDGIRPCPECGEFSLVIMEDYYVCPKCGEKYNINDHSFCQECGNLYLKLNEDIGICRECEDRKIHRF